MWVNLNCAQSVPDGEQRVSGETVQLKRRSGSGDHSRLTAIYGSDQEDDCTWLQGESLQTSVQGNGFH